MSIDYRDNKAQSGFANRDDPAEAKVDTRADTATPPNRADHQQQHDDKREKC